MRLFSIINWHHFAYMMISVALLGYGAAGTFVALSRRVLVARYAQVFVWAATAFGITSMSGFLLAQAVGFNPLEMLWNPVEPLRLAAVYGLLFVPFFCAAVPICLTFTRFARNPPASTATTSSEPAPDVSRFWEYCLRFRRWWH
jgi:hypothetical protein